MFKHPLTDLGLEGFARDWKNMPGSRARRYSNAYLLKEIDAL